TFVSIEQLSWLPEAMECICPLRRSKWRKPDDTTKDTWSGALRLIQLYSYNNLGNMTHKEGAGMTYGTQSSGCADGALSKPHALVSGAGKSYCYDRNGNMVSGTGRSLVWNAENLPSSITSGGVTESYGYNADSARVKVVRGSTETLFLEGLYEEIEGGAITKYYTLNGSVVAMRQHPAEGVVGRDAIGQGQDAAQPPRLSGLSLFAELQPQRGETLLRSCP
ncbi:MAG: hypothetical protein HC822_24550, partial [Oscillochloris sp.]|nr:hypothetical protein [Oscillochloris sp.]